MVFEPTATVESTRIFIFSHGVEGVFLSDLTPTQTSVGALWHGAFPKSYWKHFDLLELPQEKVETLKQKTVSKWLEGAPEDVVLVVPLVSTDGHFGTEGRFERTRGLLGLCANSVLLYHTSASFRPTRPNVETVKGTLKALSEEGIRVAWRADGLWAHDECEAIASETGSWLVVDPLDEDLEDIEPVVPYFYAVRGKRGFQNQLSDYEIQRLNHRVTRQPGCVSFALSGFWSDALRFVGHSAAQSSFWDE